MIKYIIFFIVAFVEIYNYINYLIRPVKMIDDSYRCDTVLKV